MDITAIDPLDKVIATLVCNIKLYPRKAYDDSSLPDDGTKIFSYLKEQLTNTQSFEIMDLSPENVSRVINAALELINESQDTSFLYDCVSEIKRKVLDEPFALQCFESIYKSLIHMGFNDFIYGIIPWKVFIAETNTHSFDELVAELETLKWTAETDYYKRFVQKYQSLLTKEIDLLLSTMPPLINIKELTPLIYGSVWRLVLYKKCNEFKVISSSTVADKLVNTLTYADWYTCSKQEIIDDCKEAFKKFEFVSEKDVLPHLEHYGFLIENEPYLDMFEQLYIEGKNRFHQEKQIDEVINLPSLEIKTEEDLLKLYDYPELTIWEVREKLTEVCHKKSKLDIRRVLYLYLTRQTETFVKFENVYCLSKKECVGVLVHYWLMKR
ncbi:hypothetical protein [Aeromonas phage AerS_266]|nr:hypothetical protein [Aeromonas phage AerS_266]